MGNILNSYGFNKLAFEQVNVKVSASEVCSGLVFLIQHFTACSEFQRMISRVAAILAFLI